MCNVNCPVALQSSSFDAFNMNHSVQLTKQVRLYVNSSIGWAHFIVAYSGDFRMLHGTDTINNLNVFNEFQNLAVALKSAFITTVWLQVQLGLELSVE